MWYPEWKKKVGAIEYVLLNFWTASIVPENSRHSVLFLANQTPFQQKGYRFFVSGFRNMSGKTQIFLHEFEGGCVFLAGVVDKAIAQTLHPAFIYRLFGF